MRVVVLNGSPKGRQSVTMQYVEYLTRRVPQAELEVHDVAHRIAVLERDAERFTAVIDAVRGADAVLWAFPVYLLLVSSQYKRFIELIHERGVEDAFAGRYAATLSTSINFYDTLAHDYMRGICEDLDMPFVGSYSAHMHDLMKPAERERLCAFAEDFLDAVRRRTTFPRVTAAVGASRGPLDLQDPVHERSVATKGQRVVVVTDARPEHVRLRALVDRFVAAFDGPVEVVNLHDVDIRGGCLGCLRCGAAYRCAYNDGFADFYNDRVRGADVLVFAGTIVARQLSSKWRQFFDRSFFNTHTPSIVGKQVAFLVSGPLSHLPEVRVGYEAWLEFQRSNLVGFVTDEGDGRALERQLGDLAERLIRLSLAGYVRPRTFLGVAGMKIFRDDLWAGLRVVFRADHRAYRAMRLYDSPQRNLLRRAVVAGAWLLTGLPGIRSRFPSMIKSQMVQPYRKIVEAAGASPAPAAAHSSL